MTARCPDCSGAMVELVLRHDDTCPLGQALDAVVDANRDWFAAHPFATEWHRPLTAAERAEQLMFGCWEAAQLTHVQVIRLGPGLRFRHAYGGGVSAYSACQVERIRGDFGCVVLDGGWDSVPASGRAGRSAQDLPATGRPSEEPAGVGAADRDEVLHPLAGIFERGSNVGHRPGSLAELALPEPVEAEHAAVHYA